MSKGRVEKFNQEVGNIFESIKAVDNKLGDVQEELKDLKSKEDHTEGLIGKALNGDVSRKLIEELADEKEKEVKEEDDVVQNLQNILGAEEKDIKGIKKLLDFIGDQESSKEDPLIQEIQSKIQNLQNNGRGIDQQSLKGLMGMLTEGFNILLHEANEEYETGKLIEHMGREEEITAQELLEEESIEKEEEKEEKQIEKLAGSINNKKLMQLIKKLEKHTAKDENSTKKEVEEELQEDEQLKEEAQELAGEAQHTEEQAQNLLKELREVKSFVKGSPLDSKNFEQNMENLYEEGEAAVEKAQESEKEAETGYNEAEDAENKLKN